MKFTNTILALCAVALATGATSCAKHDVMADKTDIGQYVPTAYWELGSTAAPAGGEFTFQGKYYTEQGYTPDHCEIWYLTARTDAAQASAKLAGSALSYTQAVSHTDTIYPMQSMASFPHSEEYKNEHGEYVLQGKVGVSRTLAPINWADRAEWDQATFDSYYPRGFAEDFCSTVNDMLTRDSTYYEALRAVYINYPFTNEAVAAANAAHGSCLPADIDMTQQDKGVAEKSDRWTATTQASDSKITGQYYYTIDEQGRTICHEVAKDYVNPDLKLMPVYESAPWLFCRYDDDLGKIVTTVRHSAMEAFKDLLKVITFPEWIYDSSNKVYKVAFTRNYSLKAEFHVFDTAGNHGKAYDVREIQVN